jgi:catechol 2,3-dioxygenase-like lactoylglutathione lyase family enzyme
MSLCAGAPGLLAGFSQPFLDLPAVESGETGRYRRDLSRSRGGIVQIDRLDHLVLTVASIDVTVDFYTRVLGMQAVTFGAGRIALSFGTSKINLHQAGHEFEPKARRPTPGSADLCLVVSEDIPGVMAELAAAGLPIEEGPVERTGALGTMTSCYLRDPDQNLIELSHYAEQDRLA